jgi:histidinol-phosphate aminotransferase
VAAPSATSFVLLRVAGGAVVREKLRRAGIAVRRGDTFPGLTADHLRVAVRDPACSAQFVAALADAADPADTADSADTADTADPADSRRSTREH